jgi:ElaB/YqjD/DUF883 family membrane-anchored ribosome-binding protein
MTKHSHSHGNNSNAPADLKDTVQDLAGETRKRLTTAFENTRQFVTHVRDKAVAGAKATDKTVQEHPYKSIAVAAGVGTLLGIILARRRSHKKRIDQDQSE